MKVKFDTFFRGSLALLVFTLMWSLWASAQSATNSAAESSTNRPSPLVQQVEKLEAHPVTFGLNHIKPLREVTLLGEPLWKYAASLVYILLAFYVAKLIDLITAVWLRRLANRTQTKFDDLLLDVVHGPVKVLALVVLLNIGLNLFDWSDKAKLYLSKGLILVVAVSLTYVAIKVVHILLVLWRRRVAQEADARFNDQLFSLLRISLTTFVVVVAVLVTAQNLEVNITAALASLSVGGVAVGLAAQDTLANLFGAIAVFVDKPFLIGDQIRLDAAEGRVEAVGLRSTRVRNPDGFLVAVPNKIMGNAAITNISKRTSIKTVMNVALARTVPAEKVKSALAAVEESYRRHPMTQDVSVCFNRFAGANLNVQVIHWWKGTDYPKYLAGIQEMNLAAKERLDAEGVGLA